MAVAEIVVAPLGTASPSISSYVADCHTVLDEMGLKYQLTPMGTVVEGEISDILQAVQKMHEKPFAKGALRVSTTLKIDDRRDIVNTMERKVKSVVEKKNK